MRNITTQLLLVALLLLTFTATASAAALTYKVVSGDTLNKIASTHRLSLAQMMSFNPQIKNINLIYPSQTVNLALASTSTQATAQPTSSKQITKKPAVKPIVIPVPVTTQTSAAGETRFVAYTTGYGWPDNTPKGSAEISNEILHTLAGGVGTYSDPITVAVGHTISGNTDTLDYKAGTKFYIPNLEKYFIVEDTCGDGNAPQNGPCHTGYLGHPWLDLWVGGNATNESATLDCEDTITDTHLVIQNPASNYKVTVGDVASTCKNYGDTVLTK